MVVSLKMKYMLYVYIFCFHQCTNFNAHSTDTLFVHTLIMNQKYYVLFPTPNIIFTPNGFLSIFLFYALKSLSKHQEVESKKFTEFCNFGPLSNIVVGECSCFGSSGLTLTNSRFTIGVQ